jgi:hypothetical protein
LRGGKPNITIAKEDVRPSNYYTNDELYQRPMTAAENRIIRTLSKGLFIFIISKITANSRAGRHEQHLRNDVKGNGLQGSVGKIFRLAYIKEFC